MSAIERPTPAQRTRRLAVLAAAVFAVVVPLVQNLAGLGLTQAVLWLGVSVLQLVPEAVKLAAAGLTFAFNYVVRKSLLFVSARRSTVNGKGLA